MPACPNCGTEVKRDQQHCPNCGATLYPRPSEEDRKTRLHKRAFGRPFSKPVAIAFAIIAGLGAAVMGGCGLFFGLQGDVTGGFGWFFAVLGLLLIAYVTWEVRRAFRNK